MTAEEFVKERMPKARAEKQKTNGGDCYWLIRDGRNVMYFASGDTKAKAWKEAKEKLLLKEQL